MWSQHESRSAHAPFMSRPRPPTPAGAHTPDRFMVSDCRKVYRETVEALGRETSPTAPPVTFENCETTLRAIWQQALPVFVREFSAPGPKAITLLYLSLSYRVTSLLLAPSKEARLAQVATGFEPPVRAMRCPPASPHVPAGSAKEQRRES